MKTFFKTLLVVALFFIAVQSQAQMSAGGGLWYGTDIDNIGISANGKYEINEQWSAAPSFTYFLKKEYVTWTALDLDANFQIKEIENLGGLYAIGGLNMTFYKITYDFGIYGGSGSWSGSNTGLNLGLGLTLDVSDKFAIAPELKYTISDGSYLRIGARILFGL